MVGEAVDHFSWKHKELCVCLTVLGSYDQIVSRSNHVFQSQYCYFMMVVPTMYKHFNG